MLQLLHDRRVNTLLAISTAPRPIGDLQQQPRKTPGEVDLATKAKALASCEVQEEGMPQKPWRADKGLMEFLRTL